MAIRPGQLVTSTTPPATDLLVKVVQVARTDTTAFEAFILPKGAVVAGAYVMGIVASDALTTATIDVGTIPGTSNQIVSGFSVKTSGVGYFVSGATSGAHMGTQLANDTLYKARYAETGTASTTGGPWLVKVEYYMPQPGYSF